MSLYAKSYERALKRYDSTLFVERNNIGVLCVFKHTKRFEPVIDSEEYRLLNLVSGRDYIFAITDTWGSNGKEKDYGVDDIINHIQKIDSLANTKFMDEFDKQNDAIDKAKDRRLKNEMEGMLAHEKKRMQRAFDTIAPISRGMSMDEPKKRFKDRSKNNGNY